MGSPCIISPSAAGAQRFGSMFSWSGAGSLSSRDSWIRTRKPSHWGPQPAASTCRSLQGAPLPQGCTRLPLSLSRAHSWVTYQIKAPAPPQGGIEAQHAGIAADHQGVKVQHPQALQAAGAGEGHIGLPAGKHSAQGDLHTIQRHALRAGKGQSQLNLKSPSSKNPNLLRQPSPVPGSPCPIQSLQQGDPHSRWV